MKRLFVVLATGAGLLGLQGLGHRQCPAADTPTMAGETSSAALTASGVRDTVDALRGGGSTSSSATLSLRTSDSRDPGPRDTAGDSGAMLAGLTAAQQYAFQVGKEEFVGAEDIDEGFGPTFNSDTCGSCHAQPAVGGTSPRVNPQVNFANSANKLPSFITANGPVREARFVRNPDGSPDGGVHAPVHDHGSPRCRGCVLAQPNFAAQLQNNNVIFRIPTPVFGAGLIETIPDTEILRNQASSTSAKQSARHSRPTQCAVDRQLDLGPAEPQRQRRHDQALWAQGTEQVAADLLGRGLQRRDGHHERAFPTERDETDGCQNLAASPNSEANSTRVAGSRSRGRRTQRDREVHGVHALPGAAETSLQVRNASPASIARGSRAVQRRRLRAVPHAIAEDRQHERRSPQLTGKPANLFSDLLVHDMGTGWPTASSRGRPEADEFRTAPLWGLGQRIFFLHDGRTNDLRKPSSSTSATAPKRDTVIQRFFNMSDSQRARRAEFPALVVARVSCDCAPLGRRAPGRVAGSEPSPRGRGYHAPLAVLVGPRGVVHCNFVPWAAAASRLRHWPSVATYSAGRPTRPRRSGLLDAFVDDGFNLIDTADVYSRWIKGHSGGERDRHRALAQEERQAQPHRAGHQGRHGYGRRQGRPGAGATSARRSMTRCAGCRPTTSTCYQAHEDDPKTPLEEALGSLWRLDPRRQGARHRRQQLQRGPSRRSAADQRQPQAAALRIDAAAVQPGRAPRLRGLNSRRCAGARSGRHQLLPGWPAAFSPANTAAKPMQARARAAATSSRST